MLYYRPCAKRATLLALVIAVLSWVIIAASAVAADDSHSEQLILLEKFIAGHMEANKIPGLSIALFKGEFSWTRGFGFSDLENKVPAKPETAYRLASVSKSMTALAVMKLWREGKLDLDGEVQAYVPYFSKKKWPVKVRQVLGHIGGISHYKDYSVEGFFTEHFDTKRAIEVFADWELIAEPGTEYNYSSYGFNLLAAAVEGASGQPFGEYIREQVWEPLGMSDTRMDDPYDLIPNRTRGYRRVNGEVKNSRFVDISSRLGGGGFRSTASDLIKYVKGLYAGKVIPREAVQMMWDSMATTDGRFTNYGMGWGTGSWSGYWVISHSGGQAETSTYLFFIPWEDFAVAICSNLEGAPVNEIAREAAGLFMGSCPLSAETPDKVTDEQCDGLNDTWNAGLGWFDRYGEPVTTEEEELANAFDYFNKAVGRDSFEKDFEAAKRKKDDGLHPVAGMPTIKVGSYMAARLGGKYGAGRLKYYREAGALPFFRDYIMLCQEDETIPWQYRLSKEMELLSTEWASVWERTWTDEVRGIAMRHQSDLGGVAQRLKELFPGEKIYPRFSNQLNYYAYYLKSQEKLGEGLSVLHIAAGLYPSDANLFDSLGEFYLEKGEQARAVEHYEKALEIDPGLASSKMALARISAVELSSEAMDALVGEYELAAGMKLTILKRENKLMIKSADEEEAEMVPQSDTVFYARDDEDVLLITFIKDEAGKAAEIKIKTGDRELPGKRIE